MSQQFEKLAVFVRNLEVALEKAEWDEVARLDLSAKSIISECVSSAAAREDREALSQLLIKLQSVYDRLSAENLERKMELGHELKKLHKERNAISQYMQSSGY